MIRAIIADDEPLARQALRDALGAGVEIVAECANGREAAEAILRLRPDVAFLDIEMPGLDGFDAIRELDHPCPVVFVTAHEEYAVEAFALEAVDYILKPVDELRVAEAVRRVRERRPPVRTHDERFIVLAHGKMIVVAAKSLRYLESAGNYVRLHTAGASPLMRGTLAGIEQRLDPTRFVRVHRSFIVNAALIAEMHLTASGDYEIVLRDGTKVPMSRTLRDAVVAKLRG